MKQKWLGLVLAVVMILCATGYHSFAVVFSPPDKYGAPANVGVVFYGDDIEDSGRWSFDIGFSASDEVRTLMEAFADGSFEGAGYSSLSVYAQGDYKLDGGQWRSELSNYDGWVYNSDCGFDASAGEWVSSYHIDDNYFDEAIPDAVLPGGKTYFDSHTMHLRVRFTIDFYNEETGENFSYTSPWSQTVSYTNQQKAEDLAPLMNHTPRLISVELKKRDDGQPYLDFKADKAHSDIAYVNSITDQRVYTNVWVRINQADWLDAGTYLWMKEQFEVDADDILGMMDNYDAAVYDVKFRYSTSYDWYPVAGKSGEVYSPFSNVISHGMPAYEGASSWAKTELDKAAGYGLITDRIKNNMSGKITREEFAEIAVKLYEKYTGKSAVPGSMSFIDTTNPEILKAANLGLVNGVGNNKYAPNDLVTREQMATILLRALKVINPKEDFSTAGVAKFLDDDKVETWARDGVYYCYKAKIVNGVGKVDGVDRFDPDGNATREMAVIVCTRAYEYYSK